ERAAAVLVGDFLRLRLAQLDAVAAVGTFDACRALRGRHLFAVRGWRRERLFARHLSSRRSHLLSQSEHRFDKLKPARKRVGDIGMSGDYRLPVWSCSGLKLVEILLGQRL